MHFHPVRSSSPPKSRWRDIIIVFVFWAAIAIFAIFFWTKFIFSVKMLFLTLIICSIPSITSNIAEKWGQFIEAVLQTFLATITVFIFSLLFLGISSIGIWVLILLVLLLVALIGGYLVRLLQAKVINRLSRNKQYTFTSSEIERLKDSAGYQILFYVSVPFGLIASTAYGFAAGLPDIDILILAPKLIIGTASIILLITLVVSAVIMSKPLILFETNIKKPFLSRENEQETFLNYVVNLLKIKSQNKYTAESDYSEVYDMAYLVADLRKVYFYDAVHSVILLTGFVLSLLSALHLKMVIDNVLVIFIAGLLCLTFFCYLPYSIGQYQLHENIFSGLNLEGLKRKETKDILSKVSPLSPQSDFVGALFATGSAGSLLAMLGYEFIKNALK